MSKPGMGQESSPTQDDQKMAAQDSHASSPHSTNRKEIEHQKRDNTKMERMFAALAENTKLQMKQQEEIHAKEIADMRQANRDAHDLFTTKTTTPQNIAMNDHRITAHFNTMTKASDTL
jgi:predicted extracellular nuclease